jgi:hypothetical protein
MESVREGKVGGRRVDGVNEAFERAGHSFWSLLLPRRLRVHSTREPV